MTTQEIIDYYANLLIIQYKEKSKAYATIQALVEPMIIDQLPLAVQDAYDLETCEGVQLDVLGKYAGVQRNNHSFTGPVVLDDDDFRTLIRIAIIRNNFESDLYSIQELLALFFPSILLVFDFQNMHMSYFFDELLGSRILAEIFVLNDMLPRPMGVQLGTLVYSNNITNFYGFRTYNVPPYNISGFNTYSNYVTPTPWLNYSNGVY